MDQYTNKTKGSQKGRQLSYILAEIVTSHGLHRGLNNGVSTGMQISLLHKYVDDLIICTNGEDINTTSGKRNIEYFAMLITNNLDGMGTTIEDEEIVHGLPSTKYMRV